MKTELEMLADSDAIMDEQRIACGKLAQYGVNLPFRPHVVDVSTGKHGIKNLIAKILKQRNAVVPVQAVANDSIFRPMAIRLGLFTHEIIAAVREDFGFNRYPDSTIKMYLSVFETERMFCKVQLTGIEDDSRTCARPRCKWLLIAE